VPSKSATEMRFPSSNHGRPSNILVLSHEFSKSARKRFSPRTLNETAPDGLHARSRGVLKKSLGITLSDWIFPTMHASPLDTRGSNSSLPTDTPTFSSSIRENFPHMSARSSSMRTEKPIKQKQGKNKTRHKTLNLKG
jgi:hypothetical protein